MILRAGYLSCPITRPGFIYSLLKKNPPLFSPYKPKLPPPFLFPQNPIDQNQLPMNKYQKFCTITSFSPKPTSPIPPISNKSAKKAMRESPERVLQHKLGCCSKNKDLVEALRLYDEARVSNVKLNVNHYNVLLYLCSLGLEGVGDLGLVRGFEIYKQMCVDGVVLNEASFTSVARLAVGKEDFEMAFDLVKEMKRCGVVPKLRSYGPALFGFCGMGMAERAYEVDGHMGENGVVGEEEEVCALLKVSSGVGRGEKVYEMLHRLRGTVRQVSEESVKVVEEWFGSEMAAEVGVEEWDAGRVKDGVVKGGGGWHGQGWLGKGKWKVVRTEMEESGVCRSCWERLVPIDIDPRETENFASSLSALACEREKRADFVQFQEWLQRHGPFDAVVDGANMGLINQQNFNFSQLNSFVNRLRDMSPSKKLPLVVLHRSRVTGGPAQNPKNKQLLENWKNAGALYATPHGSNDDWYWLYAAVSCKCLLLTNDEMRDHLFQLLGTNFFPRWKEKHQVRVNVSRQGAKFHMPPPYSIVIQESEQGSWHVPTVTGDDLESPREWLCATRTRI